MKNFMPFMVNQTTMKNMKIMKKQSLLEVFS